MRTPLRTAALKVHLYLGLTAGLVVTVVCFTGALLAFEPDIIKFSAPQRFHIEGSGPAVPMRQALDALTAALPEAKLSGVTVYQDAQRPWEFNFGPAGRAYLDPFTGAIIETGARRPTFFAKTQELHRWLLAPGVGRPIVGIATICFVFILIAALFIWWPRTMGAFRARINPFAVFSKHGGGRRKLHDLHVSLGIWCLIPLLVMALTGLPEAYAWATRSLYVLTGSEQQPPPPLSISDSTLAPLGVDSVLAIGIARLGAAKQWSVRMPQRPTGAIVVVSLPVDAWHDRVVDQLYLDRVTGTELRLDRWKDLTPGYRARRSIYPWHFGTIWGFPSKLVAFLACLFGASFPLTGFLMYRAGKQHTAE